MLPEAIAVMTEEMARLGNPSSLHNAGRRARRVVEESREQIAEVFGARASEVIFTSGGTEADNLALKGLFWARRGFRRFPGTITVEFLDPIPPGLDRDAFFARLQEEIETATGRLIAEGRRG